MNRGAFGRIFAAFIAFIAWAIYPLLYLGYLLIRGSFTHKYLYPFLNVPILGWGPVIFNAACIALAFMLAGFAVVWIDQRISSRSRTSLIAFS